MLSKQKPKVDQQTLKINCFGSGTSSRPISRTDSSLIYIHGMNKFYNVRLFKGIQVTLKQRSL